MTLSSTSLSISQGGVSPPVTVSISSKNGFAASVQITLTNLPAGVTSNPASPFTVAAGANTSVIFGAAIATATGNSTITAQAASGSLSHSATFALAIQASVLANLPRTAYARTDATSPADDPPAEPHHRHIVYDPANHHVFVANRAMNRVEVFSTSNQLPATGIGSRVAQIDVPGAASGNLAILDSNGKVLTGPIALAAGTIPIAAANPDGSRFAFVLISNGATQIILLEGTLAQIAVQASTGVRGLTFSRDGTLLFAGQTTATVPSIQVFNGQTLQTIGQVPDASIQGCSPKSKTPTKRNSSSASQTAA
jgi:hypothetical protein